MKIALVSLAVAIATLGVQALVEGRWRSALLYLAISAALCAPAYVHAVRRRRWWRQYIENYNEWIRRFPR